MGETLMTLRKVILLTFVSLLTSSVCASTANQKNISKNNLELILKSKKLCKAKKQTYIQSIYCDLDLMNEWRDQGLVEGSKEWCEKNYKQLDSHTLYAKLPVLLSKRLTARKRSDISAGKMVDGELTREDYNIEIIYIIKLLLHRGYKPKWSKEQNSQQLKAIWGSVVMYRNSAEYEARQMRAWADR